MSEYDNIANGDALDDYLVSLADGVAAAQRKMSAPSFSEAGVPGVTYQIPYLEFELKLQMSSYRESGENSESNGIKPPFRKKKLLVRKPITKEETEAVSTLRGRLVAVPVNAGRPGFNVNLNFNEIKPNEIEVLVQVTDTSGVPQVNVDVELNIDRELSNELNGKEGRQQELKNITRISQSVVKTNQEGIASGHLLIHNSEPTGNIIVITADALNETASLSYRVGA